MVIKSYPNGVTYIAQLFSESSSTELLRDKVEQENERIKKALYCIIAVASKMSCLEMRGSKN